jgi:hypothetical protein
MVLIGGQAFKYLVTESAFFLDKFSSLFTEAGDGGLDHDPDGPFLNYSCRKI